MAQKSTSIEIKRAVSRRAVSQIDWASPGQIDQPRPLGPQIYETMQLAPILEMFRPNDPINEAGLGQALVSKHINSSLEAIDAAP